MKPIGGYFEWEFANAHDNALHGNSVYLNSGRHALEYILRGLSNVSAIWIPFFTCDVVLEPLKRLGIQWKFYCIDENLEIAEDIALQNDEYLLYTNYYGVKDAYVSRLVKTYGDRLIVDNAQALFCKAEATHQFYSPRKFMGMPDGGIAVTSVPDVTGTLPVDCSYDRCSHLLKRVEMIPAEGYADFKANSKKIAEAPLSRMSGISRRILDSVDLDGVRLSRRRNFEYLHSVLGDANRLKVSPVDSFACPLVYPFWSDNGRLLKKKLIERSVFVATYWPNVLEWTKTDALEYEMADNIVCIPIDQRYGLEEMEYICLKIAE